jgi:hypothetical protein
VLTGFLNFWSVQIYPLLYALFVRTRVRMVSPKTAHKNRLKALPYYPSRISGGIGRAGAIAQFHHLNGNCYDQDLRHPIFPKNPDRAA